MKNQSNTKDFIALVPPIIPRWKTDYPSGDVDTTENADRSQESELFIVDTNGDNFKMLLEKW
jgi:hypothetical protein